jgi:hypothetical protein
MSVKRLEFLVEEPSMEAFLRELLPTWLGGIDFEVFPFQGKDDLLASLPTRLKGYSRFLPESTRLIVLIDRDDSDCKELKRQLEAVASAAALPTRSRPQNGRYSVANRIVVEELESWYFGDWEAVLAAYPKINPDQPQKAGFRDPDAIAGGTWEAFERVAQRAGYFKGGLRKVEAARFIGCRLSPETNRSGSFQAFRSVIDEIIAEP